MYLIVTLGCSHNVSSQIAHDEKEKVHHLSRVPEHGTNAVEGRGRESREHIWTNCGLNTRLYFCLL